MFKTKKKKQCIYIYIIYPQNFNKYVNQIYNNSNIGGYIHIYIIGYLVKTSSFSRQPL